MLSLVYTEILWSIVYLHHRAFELEDLIINTCRLSEKLVKYITTSRLAAEAVKVERSAASRAAAASSAVSARPVVPSSAAVSGDTTSGRGTASEKKDSASSMFNTYEEDKMHTMIDLWYKAFRLYIARNPTSAMELEKHVADMRSMTNTKSLERFHHRLDDIRSLFPKIQASSGRSAPLSISTPADVILFKQEDFNYPFDASWFEIMCIISAMGMGHKQLDTMTKELSEKGYTVPLSRLYGTMVERIGKDMRDSLLPALIAVDERMQHQVVVRDEFIEAAAGVIADYFIAMSIRYFNYAVAYTDMASGTTINKRAIETILMQLPTVHPSPLTCKQSRLVFDIMAHAVKYGSGK